MRRIKKAAKAGFTLVELMIVVAIIGVLAALAIYGVSRYLASAKTSEAKNTIGAIARGAVSAYEKETSASELKLTAGTASAASHELCATAAKVPATPPKNAKYQPSTKVDEDFNTPEWKCLNFGMTQAIYYAYSYTTGNAGPGKTAGAPDPGANGFEATAEGDLNGDGTTFSTFSRTGAVQNGEVILATQIFVKNEFE